MKIIKQHGFTLVELMISIVLGLLITAAAIQLFITGQISLRMQGAVAELQDNGNFGLNYITSDLRKANLDAGNAVITDKTKNGGVVFTQANFPTALTNIPATDSGFLTSQELTDSQVAIDNDQLVIQYKTSVSSTNCEGVNVVAGSYIIQRYFVRDGALRCDAGSYLAEAPKKEEGQEEAAPAYVISNYGSDSQIIIPAVDYMRILLGVSDDDSDGLTQKNYRYVDINTYLKSEDESGNPLIKPRVRSIQIGLLVRSTDQLTSDSNVKVRNEKEFQVLDKTVILTNPDSHLRQVITQTIALRNGFGARGSM